MVANPLASLEGIVSSSSSAVPLQLHLDSAGPAVLSFHVRADNGSTLNPDAIEIRTSGGTLVTPLFSVANRLPGNDSLVVASLANGDYVINVRGEGNSVGRFIIDAFVAGDTEADGEVDASEMGLAQAAWLQSQFAMNHVAPLALAAIGINATTWNYAPVFDANQDGKIDTFDLQASAQNHAAGKVEIQLIGDNAAPVITGGVTPDTGRFATDGITNDANAAVVGSVADASAIVQFQGRIGTSGSFINLLADLNTTTGQFTLSRARLEQIAGGTLLNNGTHILQLIAADEFGNATTTPVSISFEYDTIAPAAPSGLTLDSASDSGALGDNLTNDNTPTFNLTAEADSLVQLFRNPGGSPISIGQLIAGGTFAVTTTTLADGTHAITATATDVAGNVSTATIPLQLIIDTVAPTNLQFALDPPSGQTDPSGNALTQTTSVTIAGDSDEQSSVSLTINGSTTTIASNLDGTFSFAGVTLDFGQNSITVTATDAAGNLRTLVKTITQDNAPQLIGSSDTLELDEDEQGRQIDVASLFSDINLISGDSLTYSVRDVNGALLAVSMNGSVLTVNTQPNASGSTQFFVRATDSFGLFVEATVSVEVTPQNDAPQIVAPTNPSVVEDAATLIAGVSIVDVDADTDEMTVTLTATSGLLSVSNLANLQFDAGDGTDDVTVTFRGTLVNVNAALAGLTYKPTPDYNGIASIEISTSDNGNTGEGGALSDLGTINFTVQAVNDAPTISAPGDFATAEETALSLAGYVISDIDAGAGLMEITVSVGSGVLTVTPAGDATIVTGDGIEEATITFRGNLDDVNATLATLVYRGDLNFVGDDTLTLLVSDLGNSGLPGALTAQSMATIFVAGVNDAPLVIAPATKVVSMELESNIVGVSIADVDAGSTDVEVTITATHGTFSIGNLANLELLNGDGTDDATVTFRGTLAEINAALSELKFTSEAEYSGGASLAIEVDDLGNSGTGGIMTGQAVIAITVVENLPPTAEDDFFSTYANVTLTGNVLVANGGAADSDEDDGDESLLIASTGNYVTALGGSVTILANGNFTYSPPASIVPLVPGDILVDSFDYTLSDGQLEDIATVTITVNAVNDAPSVDLNGPGLGTGSSGFFFPGGGSVSIVESDVAVADPDIGATIESATATIVNPQDMAGNLYLEVLSVLTDGTNISAVYDPETGRLFLEGIDTLANYAQVLSTLRYNNTAAVPNTTDRVIEVIVYDGNDESSVATAIVEYNDAPVLDNSGNPTFTSITEDDVNNNGNSVNSLIEGRISDPNSNALQGIAVIATAGSGGTWQYSINNGSHWTNIGTVNNTQALLLRPEDRLRFVPNVQNAASASLSFRAWDQGAGTAGTKYNVGSGGGGLSFSSAIETAQLSITAVNDAPTFNVIQTLNPVTQVTVLAGTSMHLALSGADVDLGTVLSYSASVTGGTSGIVTPSVATGNRSMRITVPSNAEISGGVMIFQLFEDKVSAITQQIIALAQQGAYNNNRFGRISPNFVIQGGNLTGTQFTAPVMDDQYDTQLLHMGAGYLSMAKLGDGVLSSGDLVSGDDTNSSEYFITLAAARFLDGNHSVFGFQTAGHALREQIGDVSVNGETPVNPVVQQTVDIFTDPFNGVLTLSAPEGASGTSEITITVSDGNGGTMQRVIQVTVQADTANMAPVLNQIPPVSTPQNTPAVVSLTAVDAEGDNFVIDAKRRATINFDNTASERGKTPTGATAFTHKGSTWSGGEVIAARNSQGGLLESALGSFDSGIYLANGQTAQVVFNTPIDKVNFFYVHGLGVPAGTATAYDASGNVLGTVNTSAASTFADPANFKTLDFAAPIKRITFSSGIIDAFDYTQYAFAVTPTNAQGNAQLTVTPPTGFVGDIEILVRVKPVGSTTTASRIDTQIITISVNPALQANLGNSTAEMTGLKLESSHASEMAALLSAALEAWHFDTNLGADVSVEVVYCDLGGVALAMTQMVQRDAAGLTRAIITLDDDAAGRGWYLGAEAPTENDGFDLYSVLLHELGHIRGSIVGYYAAHHDEFGVMASHLSPGERTYLTDIALLTFDESDV